jgi:hypothetical protein
MTREMAKGICQHFMDAHLIENGADLNSRNFKDRGVYMLTPKGLHILERFITKNGISADHLLKVFASQPICMKLLHLERRSQDDEILITKSVIDVLFRRFVGREPNVTRLSDDELHAQFNSRSHAKAATLPPGEELDRTLGVIVRKTNAVNEKRDDYVFSAMSAIDWLCDFTTIIGIEEGAEVAAQFVRYGLIVLVSDKGKVKDYNVVVTARAGGPGGGAGAIMVSILWFKLTKSKRQSIVPPTRQSTRSPKRACRPLGGTRSPSRPHSRIKRRPCPSQTSDRKRHPTLRHRLGVLHSPPMTFRQLAVTRPAILRVRPMRRLCAGRA